MQEPDFFAVPEDLPAINVEVLGDSAEINVLSANNIDVPVNLSFEKPANGTILQMPETSRFFYKANPGFWGKDKVNYRICRDASCRTGSVLVEIKPDPSVCYPVYAQTDTFEINLPAGPGKKAIPLFPGDAYCSGNSRTITSLSAGLRYPSITDSIRFTSQFSRSQQKSFLISYSNSDRRTGLKSRHLRVNLVPEPSYCDQYFEVLNREDVITLEREDTLEINKGSFAAFIQSCDNDADPDFFQVEASPNVGIKASGEGKYKFYFRQVGMFGAGKIIYRFRNLRGVTDQGEMRVSFYGRRGH